jgi:hypothetical protein
MDENIRKLIKHAKENDEICEVQWLDIRTHNNMEESYLDRQGDLKTLMEIVTTYGKITKYDKGCIALCSEHSELGSDYTIIPIDLILSIKFLGGEK